MRLAGLLMTGALWVAGAAAQSPASNAPLTAAEMQAELFGIRMSGVVIGEGAAWTECIEPDGRSLYEIDGYKAEGQLEIRDEALACFNYPNGPSCFRVQRAPKGYMFRSPGGGSVFHATKIARGVRACFANELIG